MKAVKFILALVILAITTMYYNVFSFSRGFIQEAEDEDIMKILTQTEKVESVKVGDEYYVFFITDDAVYVEEADADDEYKVLDTMLKIKEKSIVPGIAGVGAAVLVLIFVGRKKK